MRNTILESLTSGDAIEALFHKSASADKRNAEDREKRSENGQFASIRGKVATVKQTSTGLQVIILKEEGGYGSLTSNQVITKLVINGVLV